MKYSREAPSSRYTELLNMYGQVHVEGIAGQNLSAEDTFSGTSLGPHLYMIRQLISSTGARTILDYGSGKGTKYKAENIKVKGESARSVQAYWNVDRITCFDPGYPPFAELPVGTFDGVICTDVLEHIPDLDLPWMLEEQFRYANKFVFGNIASYPAEKILPNGENAHCTVQPAGWWDELIRNAHAASGSKADYLFLVENMVLVKKWFGLKTKPKRQYVYLSSRSDWPPR
jgi:2-polyprenyl-3-methyl-5-hydroxy-6-metoxy-1,4-benzoquinol methylase